MPHKGQSQVAFKTGRESSCLVFVLVDDPEEKSDTLIYIMVLLQLDTHNTHTHNSQINLSAWFALFSPCHFYQRALSECKEGAAPSFEELLSVIKNP